VERGKFKMELNLPAYAHLGDAVYELLIREKVVRLTQKPNKMHKITTSYVCASFQAELLNKIFDDLNEEEQEIIRRGRNLPLTPHKKTNQSIHRQATAFEVIIGHLYKNSSVRYDVIVEKILQEIDFLNGKLKMENGKLGKK